MKLKELKKIAVGFGLLFTMPAFATYELGQDHAVKVLKADGKTEAIVAYPVSTSCKQWYYVPGSLSVSGNFRSLVQPAHAQVGTENPGVALVSNFLLKAENDITSDDEKRLRSEIMKVTSDSKTKKCPGDAPKNENEISLLPADVKVISLSTVEGAGPEFTQAFTGVYPTNSRGEQLTSALNSRSITLVTDLTMPDAVENLQNMISDSAQSPTEIGQIGMVLDGTVSHVKAELKIKADMKAEFESRLERTKCEETTQEGGSNPVVDGIAMTQGPVTYITKRVFDSMFPGHSKTTVCHDELLTTFKNGDVSGYFEFDTFDTNMKDDAGKSVLVQPCTDKGECGDPIPLDQFLKFELLTLYIQNNFTAISTRLSESVFEVKLGKRGTSTGTVDFSGKYGRVVNGRVIRAIPVFAKNLNPASFNLRFLNDPLYKCAAGWAAGSEDKDSNKISRYNIQTRRYSKYIQTSPMPVSDECYGPVAAGAH